MVSRESFKVERKTFVVDSTKEHMLLIEESKVVDVSIIVEVELVRRLIEKLKGLVRFEKKLGILGRKKANLQT